MGRRLAVGGVFLGLLALVFINLVDEAVITPAGPSDDRFPFVSGTVSPNSSVAIFFNADCKGPPVATTSASDRGEFRVQVAVPWNLEIQIYAEENSVEMGRYCFFAGSYTHRSPDAEAPHGIESAPTEETQRQLVVAAVRTRYIEGVTEEIAHRAVGIAGESVLLELLKDPDFEARDNVVAFLHHLGGEESVIALLNHLHEPAGNTLADADDRAILLAPQALGGIARRGNATALYALLDMTEDNGEGDVLLHTRMHSQKKSDDADDLINMAMRGLAYSQSPIALDRLEKLQNLEVRPLKSFEVDQDADQAIELFDDIAAGKDRADSQDALPDVSSDTDPAGWVREFNYRFVNHVDIDNPMTIDRTRDMAAHATFYLSTTQFEGDMACCIRMKAYSSHGSFGKHGDGLDVINTQKEKKKVFDAHAARYKVVRLINYCEGPGQNKLGCARSGGNGIAVVRMENLHLESMVWAHELGHNFGRSHHGTTAWLMNPSITGYLGHGVGLTADQCATFHRHGSRAERCGATGCL